MLRKPVSRQGTAGTAWGPRAGRGQAQSPVPFSSSCTALQRTPSPNGLWLVCLLENKPELVIHLGGKSVVLPYSLFGTEP